MENSMPDVVYYYCDNVAFKNIMLNKKIWLVDISKSNDSMEQMYLQKSIIKRIEEKIQDLSKYQSDEERKAVYALRIRKENMQHLFDLDTIKAWVMCFSTKQDDLSQWRGYGNDGNGMCIGFNSAYLDIVNLLKPRKYPILNSGEFSFRKIEYGDKAINGLIDKYVVSNAAIACDDCVDLMQMKSKPFYKPLSFAIEDEWRLAYTDHDMNLQLKFAQIEKEILSFGNKFHYSTVDFVAKEKDIVSHIEFVIKDIKEAIRDVRIGPKSKITREDMYYFLNACGYWDGYIDKNEFIKKSELTYQ